MTDQEYLLSISNLLKGGYISTSTVTREEFEKADRAYAHDLALKVKQFFENYLERPLVWSE